ncbi:MAG TPA: hypothetical protein VMV69_30440 [Pirellulales bacterium]|nr:hypothetical protein [Pirellulales bacterium]
MIPAPRAVAKQPPSTDQAAIEQAIIQLVADRDWVSFVELQRELEPKFDVRGDHAIDIGKNCIVWLGMSDCLCTAVQSLLAAERLFLHPASPFVYFIDGGLLRLPYASRPPKNGYKQPRWTPACLRVVPMKSKSHPAMKGKASSQEVTIAI